MFGGSGMFVSLLFCGISTMSSPAKKNSCASSQRACSFLVLRKR